MCLRDPFLRLMTWTGVSPKELTPELDGSEHEAQVVAPSEEPHQRKPTNEHCRDSSSSLHGRSKHACITPP